MRLLFLTILSLSLAAAQPARVEGKVVSVSGEPIAKAIVRLLDTAASGIRPTTSSDNEGKFLFEGVPPGRYSLAVTKDGFLNQFYGARSPGGRPTSVGVILSLKAGTDLKNLRVQLTPYGVISGTVIDQDGDPLAGYQILTLHYDYVRGRRRIVSDVTVQTNDKGEYRIANLAPERYFLQALNPRLIASTASDRPGRVMTEANVVTYYPSAADATYALALDVTPGREIQGIDIRVRRVRVYSVKGRAAVAGSVDSASGIRLRLAPKGADSLTLTSDRNYSYAQVQPDGSFEFRNLQPGTFELQSLGGSSISGRPATSFAAHLDITITTSDVDGANVTLTPVGRIHGIVNVEGSDLRAVLKSKDTGQAPARIQVQLSQSDGASTGGGLTQLQDDGTFEIEPISAAKYWCTVYGLPEWLYVKSVRFSGRDVTRMPVDNTLGEGGTLQIVLASGAASLSGVTKDERGEIVPGATIRIWPKIPDLGTVTEGVSSITTDQEGRFQLRGLAPGEYYVGAWDELNEGLGQSAEFLSRFYRDASLVKLEDDGGAAVDVQVISSERLAQEIARLP